jgi:dihydrofolate synthase/folylpolyglutamate synthase
LGKHQIENASLAIKAIEILRRPLAEIARSPLIKREDIRFGLKQAFIPGRLEIVEQKPLVILDGAHNPDKVKALVRAIKQIFPKKRVTAIIAIKNDKKAKEMLEEFLKICKKIIFTSFKIIADQGVVSSYKPEELMDIITDSSTANESLRNTFQVSLRPAVIFRLIEDPTKALNMAINEAGKDDLILVTGSLYLVGEIKKNLELRIKN